MIEKISPFLLFTNIACALNGYALPGNANSLRESSCINLPPNLMQQQFGVDIRKFNPSPITLENNNSLHVNDNGFKAQLFEYTCDQNQTFVDALNGNVVYQIPDQLSAMYIDSRGYFNSTFQNYETAEAYREATSKNLGIGANFLNVSLRHTASFRKLILQESVEMRKYSTVFALFSSTVSELQPAWFVNVSSQANADLQALPNSFDKNPQAYCKFVDKYGTHYIDVAEFGGIFRASYFVDEIYVQQSTSSLSDDAEAEMFAIVRGRGAHNIQPPVNQTVSVGFKRHSTSEIVFKGGDEEKMTNTTGFDEWWQSVVKKPSLIGAQLKPISNLLAISNLPKSESLGHAGILYVNGACTEIYRY